MPGKAEPKGCEQAAAAEMFRLQLPPGAILPFFREAKALHQYFSTLSGYTGLDILLLSETELLVLVRWQNWKQLDEQLPMLLHGEPVANWLKPALQLNHQPVMMKALSLTESTQL